MVDYYGLYTRVNIENEINRRKLARLENRQRIYERTFQNFRKLQNELFDIQREAEVRNDKIKDYLKTFLPHFSLSEYERFEDSENDDPKPPERNATKITLVQEPTLIENGNLPPTPDKIDYDWSEYHSSPSAYKYLTRSNPFVKCDELKLCLKFDLDSKDLPTKINLEIRDKSDRVVYSKRQNIYYVKIQERIPTLNSEQDYQLQVTTITGLDKNTKTVTIYNKNHKEITSLQQDQPVNTSKEPVNSRIEEIDIENSFDENNDDDISLANAIQEFLEEVDYMEAKPIKGDEFLTSIEPKEVPPLKEVKKTSCVILKRQNVAPITMHKKLAIPEVCHRWQRGFRKAANGRYVKVPILRLIFKFKEEFELLPNCLYLKYLQDGKPCSVSLRLSQHQSVIELQLTDDTCYQIEVFPKEEEESIVPKMVLKIEQLKEEYLNEWRKTSPDIQ